MKNIKYILLILIAVGCVCLLFQFLIKKKEIELLGIVELSKRFQNAEEVCIKGEFTDDSTMASLGHTQGIHREYTAKEKRQFDMVYQLLFSRIIRKECLDEGETLSGASTMDITVKSHDFADTEIRVIAGEWIFINNQFRKAYISGNDLDEAMFNWIKEQERLDASTHK